MKKLISQSLLLVMCTGLVAFAQDAPPEINLEGLENLLTQPAAGPQQQQATPAAGQQSGQNFNLGSITNTNPSPTNNQGQAVSPVFIAPAAGQNLQQQAFPQQGFQAASFPNTFQANLGARSLAGPPQVAATGPGMLAGLIPVAAYSLIAFRRKQN